MKTFIVDIPSGLTDATNVLAALKVYAAKNKSYRLLCCGASSDFSILEDNVNITCEYTEGKQTSSTKALSHLGDQDVVGLLSFSRHGDLFAAAHASLQKEISPCFGLSFHGQDSSKETFLVDAGGFTAESQESIEASLSYALDYLTNILKMPKDYISVGYLAFKESLSPLNKEIDAFLRGQSFNYRGIVDPSEIMDGASVILLSSGVLGPSCLAAANEGKKVLTNRQTVSSSVNPFVKWTSPKPVETGDFDREGYLLFGYGHHIYSLSQKAHYEDVMTGLKALERYDRNQPR